VEYLISTAAVGSFKKELKPCDFIIANQLIDRTYKRISTFFEDSIVAHVSFADPFCKIFSDIALKIIDKEGINAHLGTYICIEGPQFSTRAESNLYRSWNVDVIGMTLASESKLAREAEMCLCGILAVTDYDCWYKDEEDVSVSSVIKNLKNNDENMVRIIKKLIPKIYYERNCKCQNALENALITSPEYIEKHANQWANRILLKKYLK